MVTTLNPHALMLGVKRNFGLIFVRNITIKTLFIACQFHLCQITDLDMVLPHCKEKLTVTKITINNTKNVLQYLLI